MLLKGWPPGFTTVTQSVTSRSQGEHLLEAQLSDTTKGVKLR